MRSIFWGRWNKWEWIISKDACGEKILFSEKMFKRWINEMASGDCQAILWSGLISHLNVYTISFSSHERIREPYNCSRKAGADVSLRARNIAPLPRPTKHTKGRGRGEGSYKVGTRKGKNIKSANFSCHTSFTRLLVIVGSYESNRFRKILEINSFTLSWFKI